MGRPRATGWPREFDAKAGPPIGGLQPELADLDFYPVQLDTARDRELLDIGGRFLWIQSTSGSDAQLTIRFNHSGGTGFVAKRGIQISGVPFSRLYISHAAQAGKSVVIAYSQHHIDVQNSLALAALVEVEQPDTLETASVSVTGISGTPTLIQAADSTLRGYVVRAKSSNTEDIVLTHSSSGTSGFTLAAGESLSFPGTDAMYAFRGSANQTVEIARALKS